VIEQEKDFLDYISGEVDTLIDTLCDSYDISRSFYNFHLECTILDSECENALSRQTLFDDHILFCRFCREKTFFTDDEGPICPDCLRRLDGGEKC